MARFTSKVSVFFKGMCMGFSDVVPGVSGGTIALMLGIYERFIAALKGLNGGLLRSLLMMIGSGFSAEGRRMFVESARKSDLLWLLVLIFGLLSAIGIGSLIIPRAMELYPVLMWSFFFGLVFGSITVPYRMAEVRGIAFWGMLVVFSVGSFFVLGFSFSGFGEIIPVIASDSGSGYETLGELCGRSGCMEAPGTVAVSALNLGVFGDLSRFGGDFSSLELVSGSEVFVKVPSLLYVFLCGFIAICAMVLPGISGSFILLLLGMYYYIFSNVGRLVRGFGGGFAWDSLLRMVVFGLGVLAGLVLFSRFLTWLFSRYRDVTLAAIIGIMAGSLRVIWPYQVTESTGIAINVFPVIDSLFFGAVLCMVFGASLAIFVGYKGGSISVEPDKV